MPIAAGGAAPDFEQDTANGSIRFHAWLGQAWCLLFLQTTPFEGGIADIAALLSLRRQWAVRGIKLVGVAPDTAAGILQAVAALEAANAPLTGMPLVADADGAVAVIYQTTGAQPGTRHAVIIDPTRRIRLVTVYPPGTRCDPAALLQTIEATQTADAISLTERQDTQAGRSPASVIRSINRLNP